MVRKFATALAGKWLFCLPVLTAAALLFPAGQAAAQEEDCLESMRYTFSWSMEKCSLAPRGGTTQGPEVTLDPDPHPGWKALQEEGLSRHERDRRAILAMSGPYRTSFEFLETVGYTPDFSRSRPYHSWGTEYVHVVEEKQDYISLQHILVMFVQGEDGELEGPFVQKHWRQDWEYEKPYILEYAGGDTWERRELDEEAYQGTWAQSVYQVDDAPRYESYGRWRHYENFSTWEGEVTWRPLPRRESSVRDDYQVLEAINRHTIVPSGWVHEEENYKVKLNEDGERTGSMPYLAKELGVNRYDRIVDFDFSAGHEYWESTSRFWRDVREVWREYIDANRRLEIAPVSEGTPLFAALFERAESVSEQDSHDAEANKAAIREILDDYIE